MLHLKKQIRFLDDKIAWLKRQDKGPPSKSETTYLDTLMSNFGEFFELGHEYQKCNHDDLPRLLCIKAQTTRSDKRSSFKLPCGC